MAQPAHRPRSATGAAVVALAGELDLSSVEALWALATTPLDQPGTRTLIFDLAAVTFMDSSVIGALVKIRDTAAPRGVTLELVNVSDKVMRVLEITGVADHLGASLPA